MQNYTLTFVTTNSTKFREISKFLSEFRPEIKLEQASLEIPEIQSLDVKEVAIAKAILAWDMLKKPLIIDDDGIYIEQYSNFPGPLVKWVFKGIGLDGFWKLAESDPRVKFLCSIIYIDNLESYQIFDGELKGIAVKPRGIIKNKEMPFPEIFIPEGYTQIFSEIKDLEEYKHINHRYKAVKALAKAIFKN